MEPYESQLNRLPAEVSFGVTTIRIVPAGLREQLQLGYGRSAEGEFLTGEAMGDWKPTWLVIGQDDTFGDPIFVDTGEEGFPVFTAMHGQGDWKPSTIASSLEGFERALRLLMEASHGREDPITLQSNPLTERERSAILSGIRESNPTVDLEFWAAILDAS